MRGSIGGAFPRLTIWSDDNADLLAKVLRAEDRMLEIGCGTGSTALHLAPDVAEVTAIEISREMIAIAERKRMEHALRK